MLIAMICTSCCFPLLLLSLISTLAKGPFIPRSTNQPREEHRS